MNSDMLQVTVPVNSGPGQELLIRAPGDDRVISAIVPEGHGPGHTFFVRRPPPIAAQGVAISNNNGQPQQHQQTPTHNTPKKYKRCSEEMLLLHNEGLVKVKVPKGCRAGDSFRVRIPDGRTVDAVVPQGNVTEFHLKVNQKKQNWHDNPLAVAPMTLGPLFSL
jgi:hypothetical protein